MPIPLPILDDRRWKDLVEEGRSLIPAWAPEWTDHNPSDPGITLIELFAYLAEMMLYRVDRISKKNLKAFLKLLEGPQTSTTGPVEERLRTAVAGLQYVERAVTAEDYEALACQAGAGRALCIPHRNLGTGKATCIRQEAPGHDSVVILPREGQQESPELLEYVEQMLDQARLLATRVHVVYPRYVEIAVRITLIPDVHADRNQVRVDAMLELHRFFDPYRGGPNRDGWPLGRNIYVSEIYALLEDLPGVDYVQKSATSVSRAPLTEIAVSAPKSGRLRFNSLGELEAVELLANELPRLGITNSEIIV